MALPIAPVRASKNARKTSKKVSHPTSKKSLSLEERIKKAKPRGKAAIYYSLGCFAEFKKVLRAWDMLGRCDPPKLPGLFERDLKWAQEVWARFSWRSEIQAIFRQHKQNLLDRGDDIAVKKFMKACGNNPVYTYPELVARAKER